MKKAALVTSERFPHLTPDDSLFIEPLLKFGIKGCPVVWDDPAVNWEEFDQIILRSPWDYVAKFPDFLSWLASLESLGLPMANPYPVIYWNLDKHYLRELELGGFSIVPTLWAEKGETLRLSHILKKQGWEKAVIKPTLSAGGRQAILVTLKEAELFQPLFEENLQRADCMVQKFMPSIYSEGEWSLIFFEGIFSHAVLKHPGKEDFRVQPYYGGTEKAQEAPEWLIEKAQKIVQAVTAPLSAQRARKWRGATGSLMSPWLGTGHFARGVVKHPCLYARVDGLIENGSFFLMELEVLEPALYLAYHTEAPERFARAVFRLMNKPLPTSLLS